MPEGGGDALREWSDVDTEDYNRLSGEINACLKNNAWEGLDSNYVELTNLEAKAGADRVKKVTFENHYFGAQAANRLGNITHEKERLESALTVGGATEEETGKAVARLNEIKATYGAVKIENKSEKEANLTPKEMPFAPEKQNVIKAAQLQVLSLKGYEGLLPAGRYTFGSLTFEVKENQAKETHVLGASK